MPDVDRSAIPVPDELRGQRVLVRPYQVADAAALQEAVAQSRDHLRPWMPFADAHQSVAETAAWIQGTISRWLLREEFAHGIWDAATGRYLGAVGLHPRDWDAGRFEIGYWLRADAEGHGYMREAALLVMQMAADVLDANRLEIRCDARNHRSAAVAERLGFVREGALRNHARATDGSLRTTMIYGLIPTDESWPRRDTSR